VEPGIVDAVEMPDLVDERGVHFVAQFGLRRACREVRLAVDDDAVWQLADAVPVALGESDSVVQTEQIEAAVVGAVFDHEYDVVEAVDHVVGEPVELVGDEFFKGRSIPIVHGHQTSVTRPEPRNSGLKSSLG
jgi:hypothetical protein